MSIYHIAITDIYTVVQSNFMVAAHEKSLGYIRRGA